MRLIVLTTTFPKHKNDFGTPRFVYDLAYNISEKGIYTLTLTPDRPDSLILKEKISDNFHIYRFRYFFKKLQNLTSGEGIVPTLKKSKFNYILIPFLLCCQIFFAMKYIKKNKIDIINSHWLVPSGFIGAVFQRLFKRKNFVTVHAAGLYLLEKLAFGKFFAKFIYENSTRILVVSNFGREKFYLLLSKPNRKEFEKKVIVIPMGVNITNITQIKGTQLLDNNKFNVLFIGRLAEKKGLKFAIEALRDIKDLDIQFHICGDGVLRNKLEKTVSNYKLDEKIKFYGRISEELKKDLLNSSDILLVPSIETAEGDKEGLPVVILEALAAGLPVVGCDVGGIRDGLIHNKTGLLIEQKNIEEIKNAIEKLYKNKEMLINFKKNAKKHSINFDWSEISKKYIMEMKSS
ncbi:MAG: glycosyltransferase family 4 protein [Candidatus Heimdallarchaeota archaeon]